MKKVLILLVTIVFAASLAGCGKTACKRICDCWDGYPGGEDDCIDDCHDDYMDEDVGCRGAIRDWARCMDDEACDEYECIDEAEEVADECPIGY